MASQPGLSDTATASSAKNLGGLAPVPDLRANSGDGNTATRFISISAAEEAVLGRGRREIIERLQMIARTDPELTSTIIYDIPDQVDRAEEKLEEHYSRVRDRQILWKQIHNSEMFDILEHHSTQQKVILLHSGNSERLSDHESTLLFMDHLNDLPGVPEDMDRRIGFPEQLCKEAWSTKSEEDPTVVLSEVQVKTTPILKLPEGPTWSIEDQVFWAKGISAQARRGIVPYLRDNTRGLTIEGGYDTDSLFESINKAYVRSAQQCIADSEDGTLPCPATPQEQSENEDIEFDIWHEDGNSTHLRLGWLDILSVEKTTENRTRHYDQGSLKVHDGRTGLGTFPDTHPLKLSLGGYTTPVC